MAKKLITVIFFLAAALSTFAQEARVTEVTGTVEVKNSASGSWESAAVGTVIGKNTVLSTGIKSSAVISLGSSKVSVGALAMLTLEELTQQGGTEKTDLLLRSGRVKADVTPPAGLKAEFTVRSPTTTASVRGTSFTFDGKKLFVHNGQVTLSNNSGQKVFVNQNQRSYLDSDQHGKVTLPYETETSDARVTFVDTEKTGVADKGQKSGSQKVKVDIDIGWN